jgi:hypothetical protein
MSTRAHLNLESIFFFEVLEYGAGLLKKTSIKYTFLVNFGYFRYFFSETAVFLSFILEYHGTILYFLQMYSTNNGRQRLASPGIFAGRPFRLGVARARARGMEPESTLPSFRDVCDFSII